jgi:[acyl-carrier-protein] S-malonyltransferase
MTVFLFAGQGVEPPWVSPELLGDPCVAQLLDVASEAIRASAAAVEVDRASGHAAGRAGSSLDLRRLLARGGRELARTEVLQPALVAVCLGIVRRLARAGLEPSIVLGHSLGELAAWAAAGGITDEDAVRLAAIRGALMAREAARRPGGMLRVLCDLDSCERALAEAARAGAAGAEAVPAGAEAAPAGAKAAPAGAKAAPTGAEAAPTGAVCLAAHHAPGEHVISGDPAPLAWLAARLPSTRLDVAGAWHSPAMAGAADDFAAAVAAVPRRPLRARMIANRDGRFVDGADVPERLAGQLVRPIQWTAAMATLAAAAPAPARLCAIGPGKLLRRLVRDNLGAAREVEIVDSAPAIAAAAPGAHAKPEAHALA